jgi:hypothetical protein
MLILTALDGLSSMLVQPYVPLIFGRNDECRLDVEQNHFFDRSHDLHPCHSRIVGIEIGLVGFAQFAQPNCRIGDGSMSMGEADRTAHPSDASTDPWTLS